MQIYRLEQFLGPAGQMIEELTLVDADTNEPVTADQIESTEDSEIDLHGFLGHLRIAHPVIDRSGQPLFMQQQDVKFPIDADTRSEAIEKFESSFKEFMEEQRKLAEEAAQEEQSRLVIPSAQESVAINSSNKIHLS